LNHSNILRTVFSTPTGKIAVTDFMPVGRAASAGVHDYVTLNAPLWLVRSVEGLTGSVSVRIRYRPTVDFARRPARLTSTRFGIAVEGGPSLATDIALSVNADLAEGTVVLRTGERRNVVVATKPIGDVLLAEHIHRLFEITRAFWEEWSSYCRYAGPYAEMVLRSALVLKLLTYAPTGAIVAAPTTSLPEMIGGERNWDYRYCWLRDATFTLYALSALGYSGEARRFADFL
jgi:GH15 family glucan-1,4-alpha-glucosidase